MAGQSCINFFINKVCLIEVNLKKQNYLTSQTNIQSFSYPFFLVAWDASDNDQLEHRKYVIARASQQTMGMFFVI